MLYPKLSNCPDCNTIPALIGKIDCKIAELSNNLYNNTVFILNKPVNGTLMNDLLNYRRILSYKYCNPDYASCYSVNMIASRVNLLTAGAKNCNNCGKTSSNCDDKPSTTTTTTTSTSPTTSTTSSTSSTTSSTSSTTSSTSSTTSSTSSTTSTTSTTTTQPSAGRTVNCGEINSYYVGGQTYPTIDEVILGSDIGTVAIQYNTLSQPDRILVVYDGSIVVDTGFIGNAFAFDYGSPSRLDFTSALTGLPDAVTGLIYPYADISHAPDNYPYVQFPEVNVQTFNKYSSLVTSAFVKVYAPLIGTGWEYQMGCPVISPEIPCICMAAYNYSTTETHFISCNDCNGDPVTIPIGFTSADNTINFCTSGNVTPDNVFDVQLYLTLNNCVGGNCPEYPCNCITFTNPSPGEFMDCYWQDCFGRRQYTGVAAATYQTCGSNPSSPTPGVTISTGSACISSPGAPLEYTCPLPLQPQRCTAIGNGIPGESANAGYKMESAWNDGQLPNPPDGIYSFEIIDLTLDGVSYGIGSTITITAPDDLVVGPGIFGGTYVQNINDWLNSIPGVASSGFVFYDDMSTVDTPDVNSTYNVTIQRTTVRTGDSWYYRWAKDEFGTTGYGYNGSLPITVQCYRGCWGCTNL